MTANHSLEGNGPLVMEVYEKIETVRATIQAGHTPNVNAVSNCAVIVIKVCWKESSVHCAQVHQALQQNTIHYETACVQPGLDYFKVVVKWKLW